ncbi:PREDICTED: receptor-like serine/threonine-protein kinase SD1-6 [Ipomoea nil]|uniref:receptor-like serine/threonine-protein kinase SD1-6 n=1 Tax=Ipomoea nil TaxID=35883 RepID=UPI000900C369|nr:PREDICTED: receptor-like serine/threonine-protein kinase SD1-6 [Ipomoea nil]
MEMNSFVLLCCLLILPISLLNNTPFSHGVETISGNKYITQATTISSPNGRFELGFFTPAQSSKYYIGIWYKNISPQTVVWVANRVTPIPSSAINSSKLRVLDGDLVLVDGAQNLVWSTNLSASSVTTVKRNSVQATLRDSGNLVLSDDGMNSTTPLWQSFDHSTHTFLPGAKFGYNKRTKTTYGFTSWKSWDDPAPGLFSSIGSDGGVAFQMWNGTEEYWKSGPKFGTDKYKPNSAHSRTFVDNENEIYFAYNVLNPSVICRHIIDVNGQEKTLVWSEAQKVWMSTDVRPSQECDVYAYCGPFSICSDNSTTVCVCLQGFKYKSQREWRFNEFSGGCVRNTSLKCSGSNNYEEEDMDVDRFIMYPNVRLPRHPQNIIAETQAECESSCVNNCSCTAYAYSNSSGSHCRIWVGQLLNLKQLGKYDINGSTIYIRVAATEFSNIKDTNSKQSPGKLKAIIASVAVAAAALVACTIFCVCYKRRRAALKITVDDAMDETIDDENGIGVPLITFQSILEATNNFSNANKLGEGGFGPVYKGMLLDGEEVAIKRLSSQSSQGINEFKNEVVLIGKLQHRNLVKLVGYCTQVGEKILLYEYMPNKSLDTFIFDQTRRLLLDWSKRFDIILGIVRGLVYLHHDSRLRIIHRDMKTNNILLDEEMIPKISDFGLARLVAGNTFEANTKKVVGTFGYMSPEYALSGLFSTKSDVFSFGVIILEIICGKKNTSFYQHEVSNLLGYAWKLWSEGNAMDLLDGSLLGCCTECEVLKCINVGLICVEEAPNRRPSMPNVFLMLTDESMNLPKPYQPAFVTRNRICNDPSTIESDKPCSNQLTFSTQEEDTNSKQFLAIIASVAVAAAALVASTIFCVCYKRRRAAFKITELAVDAIMDEDTDGVPLITFQSILEATNNFSDANKLGEGGFGPVYKGMLLDGQEIAIKRLSSQSKQGIKEFKNEVALIGKLQHRNLVKLVGYCTQMKEKILLYEYMPNKSLDTFIFDQTRRLLLDWSKRFDIILGIVRGLVYLHHDSRLRIIHRDMKTNNILLDEEMTPKISDFGLARLVAGNTFEANTKKIAGTYGYMSPEYALSGLFSTKSDVFSFGVIILEIICGKKNTALYQHGEVSNLLGYAWKLWNEGNAMDLLDDSVECCKECEVLKCINVGLLCVEEDPNRRPSMPTVFLMLTDESMNLPKPNQPAFVTRNWICNVSSTAESEKPCSNQLTFSIQKGR